MAGWDVRRNNQARKVVRNDGAALLSLPSLAEGWIVPPGSSITAGSAETVSAANKQASQTWSGAAKGASAGVHITTLCFELRQVQQGTCPDS